MTEELKIIRTSSTDPYHNLALEECLLEDVAPGQCILYLWQNRRTVVIGRNQNAAAQCRIDLLEGDGGHLARRLSGGGAVYHDLGNLNFTFLMPTGDFHADRQSAVILEALRHLGIQAQKNGRNDLTIDGRKFSGHAYYHHGGRSYHHGTLMIDVDRSQMERYLNVPQAKLKAKGVDSVRSRVLNLSEYAPSLTTEAMKDALIRAFAQIYECPVHEIPEESIDLQRLGIHRERLSSPTWKYGKVCLAEDEPADPAAAAIDAAHRMHPAHVVKNPGCGETRPDSAARDPGGEADSSTGAASFSRERKFDWGLTRVDFSVRGDVIAKAVLWSDGLDAEFLSTAAGRITGCRLDVPAIFAALHPVGDLQHEMAADIAAMISG